MLVDGEEVDFYEMKTVAGRTLTVDFAMGSKEIMIVGTTVLGGEILQKDIVKSWKVLTHHGMTKSISNLRH